MQCGKKLNAYEQDKNACWQNDENANGKFQIKW